MNRTAQEPICHTLVMDQYALIDGSTLVRNLNAVCRELGRLVNQTTPFGGPPALTPSNTDAIPLALYRIAVRAGWIEEQEDLDEREYESRRDADLFAGELHFTVSFNEWFLGLVSDTLAEIEDVAQQNAEAQNQYKEKLHHHAFLELKETMQLENKNPVRSLMDRFFNDPGTTISNITDLADAANKIGITQTPPVVVTRVSVSRLYNGHRYIGPRIRKVVASVINSVIPCTGDDLRPPRKSKPRS